MVKKYKLTDDMTEIEGTTFYRIEALMDFGNIKAGDKGGYVRSENNLSQYGLCWVSDDALIDNKARIQCNAKIYGNAIVYGNARIYGNAEIYGDAMISGNSKITGNTKIYGNARIYDKSKIYGNTEICDDVTVVKNARIYGNAKIHGKAMIADNVKIYGDAEIYGDAGIIGNTKVYENAKIYGKTMIGGNVKIYGDAKIYGEAGITGNTKVYDNTKIHGKAIIGNKVKIYEFAEIYGNACIVENVKVHGNTKVYGDAKILKNANIHGNVKIYGDAEIFKTIKSNSEIYNYNSGVLTIPSSETARANIEYKFGGSQGHGFAAEEANNLIDKIQLKDAKIVGRDNSKDGADRLVDGKLVQTKYCQNAKASVDSAFKDGSYRYSGMELEVPSDQYDEAVKEFATKISEGKVPGETNPANAKNYIRKGHITYQQAKNIAKAGNIDSITYDATQGIIIGLTSVGVSASIEIAVAVWNKTPVDKAIKQIVPSLFKTFTKTVAITTMSGQILKSPLRKMISNFLVEQVGVKVLTKSGKEMTKKAAKTALTKGASGPIVNIVTFTVLSTGDIVRMFSGRISFKQLAKNMAITGAGMAGAAGGAAIGGILGPLGIMAGTIIGGLIGGVVSKEILSGIKDDADEMQEILEDEFQHLAVDYIITQVEAENIVKGISEKINASFLRDMYQASSRRSFAREFLEPYFEQELKNRPPVKMLKKLNRLTKKTRYNNLIIFTLLAILIYYKFDIIISLYTQISDNVIGIYNQISNNQKP